MMVDFRGILHSVRAPFLHSGAVDILSFMLGGCGSAYALRSGVIMQRVFTSNVIHDIGSSFGISVRLTSSRVSFSSSNTTVKIAPGGVLRGLEELANRFPSFMTIWERYAAIWLQKIS